MADPRKRKTSYDFDAEAKHRLESLKSDLRREGYSASETAILEVLIRGAKVAELKKHFERH